MKKILCLLLVFISIYGHALTKSVPIDKPEIVNNDLPRIALTNANGDACELYLTMNNIGKPFKTVPGCELLFIVNYTDTVRLYRKQFESETHEMPTTRKGEKVQLFISVLTYDVPNIKKLTHGGITKIAIQSADGSFANYDISSNYQMTLPNEINSLYNSLLSEASKSTTTSQTKKKSWFQTGMFWLLGVAAVLLYFAFQPSKKKENIFTQNDNSPQPQKDLSYKVTVTMTTDEDGYRYDIKGINFCNIDDTMLGDFFGTVRALKSNTHDPYAIGVYRGNKRVGFLPRGNKELHAKIMSVGGSTGIEGYIAKAEDNGRTFYYGKVNLLEI